MLISNLATLQQQSCNDGDLSEFANALPVAGLAEDTEFVRSLASWAELSPSKVAERAKLAATTVLRPFNGTATSRISQPTRDKLQAAFPDYPGWREGALPASQVRATPTREVDADTVEIGKLDLTLSMGPGTLIGDFVEETVYHFDSRLLRAITRTPPSRLKLVTGIGDSMYPTLQQADDILIDTTDRQLARQDGIYWIDLFGAAGLKRLRTIGRGKVLVQSDNPSVANQEVDAEDLRIDGRAIWVMRGL